MDGDRMQACRRTHTHTHKSTNTHTPPQALIEGQWSLSGEYKELIDWVLTQGFTIEQKTETEKKGSTGKKKVWAKEGSLAGRVLETHLLHRSFHWFFILPVVSFGFQAAGFPPSTPSIFQHCLSIPHIFCLLRMANRSFKMHRKICKKNNQENLNVSLFIYFSPFMSIPNLLFLIRDHTLTLWFGFNFVWQ